MNAASLPLDPPSAVEGLATPNPLTLGQLALLEKIKSPLLGERCKPDLLDLLPSLYLLTLPAAEGVQHLDTLKPDAMAWADGQTLDTIHRAAAEAQKALAAFFDALPRPTEEGKRKNASPATASC